MPPNEHNATQQPPGINEPQSSERAYQRRFIRLIIIAFLPLLLGYVFLFYYYGYHVQAFLFLVWVINGIVGLILGNWVHSQQGEIRLKRISVNIGFAVLIIALLHGIMIADIAVFMPLFYTMGTALVLLLGRRIGFLYATICCIAGAAVIVLTVPARFATENIAMLKLNMVVCLFALLIWAYINENTRVRVQKRLVKARNKFQAAEERQRVANIDLQHEIELRTKSEKALTHSEMRYRALFEESAVSLWEEDYSQVKDYLDQLSQSTAEDLWAYFKQNPSEIDKCIPMMKVTAVNRATLNLYEADTPGTLIENVFDIMPPNANDYLLERIIALYLNHRYDAELPARTLTGRPLHILISSNIPVGYEASFQKVFTTVYDITERVAMDLEKQRMDQQLQQARQMEAVGTLAGGIAHQFNNALGVIYGGLDLIEMDANVYPESELFFNSLKSSANRMSQLTDQLLAYAHGGKYQPKEFSANDLIHSILADPEKAQKPAFNIRTHLAPDICRVWGDMTQIQMVIEAVLANAYESMSNGGDVSLKTYNQSVDKAAANGGNGFAPGDYAVVEIKDQGTGMAPETLQRIFEPFFTTKFFGRGLGMAAAYGIITNHDGIIKIDSTPNNGTCVRIYLPARDIGKK